MADTTANSDLTGPPVASLIDGWRALRAELHAIEEAEHPDVTDAHGRVWRWESRDLYTHDDILAWPLTAITGGTFGLPTSALADNPNYVGLCGTCRRNWPTEER